MLRIASRQVSGQLLPRSARCSKVETPILAYFNAVGTGNSPSQDANIKIRHAIHVVQVNDGHVSGALDGEERYFFNAASSDRDDAMQVCKAFLYSALGFSAARRGLFIEMIASCLRIINSSRW